MAKKKSEIDELDDELLDVEGDDEDYDLDDIKADSKLLARRRIEELREEKELQNSIWGDMDW